MKIGVEAVREVSDSKFFIRGPDELGSNLLQSIFGFLS